MNKIGCVYWKSLTQNGKNLRSFSTSSLSRNITHGLDGKVYRIQFDHPPKNNAITMEMFKEWNKAVRIAHQSTASIVTMTGNGKFYTAGSNLQPFEHLHTDEQRTELAREVMHVVQDLTDALIDLKKPLVALLNGPCVGIGVTTLGLCDAVIASDQTYLWTPFTKLGYTPEAGSSGTFKIIHGYLWASELLVFARKLSAQDAYAAQMITRIIPHANFLTESENIVQELAQLPPETMELNKKCIRGYDKEFLKKVNRDEVVLEIERWTSEECKKGTMEFVKNRKNKKGGK